MPSYHFRICDYKIEKKVNRHYKSNLLDTYKIEKFNNKKKCIREYYNEINN